MVKENTIICIFGMKGGGKSYLTGQIIEEQKRVIVIDNQQEYDLKEIGIGYRDCVQKIVDASKLKRYKVSLRAENIEEDLDLLRLASTIQNQWIVIEEASKYVSHAKLSDEIAHLIRFGRHDAISQIYLARRASELHRDITANADVIISFHQHEPRDVMYLRDFMGDRANKVRRLKKYHFIAYGKRSKAPKIVLERLDNNSK